MSKLHFFVVMTVHVGSVCAAVFSYLFLVALPRTMPEYSIWFWSTCILLSYLTGFVSSFLHWHLFRSTIPPPPVHARPVVRQGTRDGGTEAILELTYEPSYDDLFRQEVIRLWTIANAARFMLGTCFPAAFVGTALLFLWSGKQLSTATTLSLFLFLSAIAAALGTVLKASHAGRKRARQDLESIRISPEGVERVSKNNEVRILSWADLNAVKERKFQFVLYGKSNQIEVIDKSAIPSQDALVQVRSLLEKGLSK